MKRGAVLIVVLILFAAGLLRLGHIAIYDGPNADEESGIGEARDISTLELLRRGPPVEVNPSPLNYLMDKAWLNLHGGDPHRRYNLNVFFRVLPIFYVVTGTVLLALLALRASGMMGLPFLPSLLMALAVGIFFQTNLLTMRNGAVSDRPYGLWYFFSSAQLWLLLRQPPGPTWKFGLLHALFCFNSFGAALQVAVGVLVRAAAAPFSRKTLTGFALETLPSAAIAIWYWVGAPRLHMPSPDQRGLADLWLEAIGRGVFSLSTAFFGGTQHDPGWAWVGWPAILFALLLVAAAPFTFRPARTLGWAVLLVVVTAVPVTWVALNIAKSLQNRYFVFLFPAMGLAQVFAVLWAAHWVKEKTRRPALAGALLIAWASGQLAYRVRPLPEDMEMIRSIPRYPLYVSEPLPGCPAELGEFRKGTARGASPGDIDVQRLQAACLPVYKTEP